MNWIEMKWKWIFIIFKCKNEFPKQLRLEKQMKKNGVLCLVFMSCSWIMVLKLSKTVSFLQIIADVSKKSEAVIAIFVYASESSRFALLENGIGHHAMT